MKKNLYAFIIPLLSAICISFIFSCGKKSDPKPTPPAVDSLKIGLLAYYQFNNSGADSSGKGNDAYNYHNLTSTDNRFGKPNSAFYFNGTDGYMVIKDNNSLRLSNTDFTLNVWVEFDSYNNSFGSEILCKRGEGHTNGWNYGITGVEDQIHGYPIGAPSYQVSGSSDPIAIGINPIGLGHWHMLTTVYSLTNQTISYYEDGVFQNTLGNIPSPNPSTAADLYIGQDSQGSGATAYYLQGKLDDIRIYNRAISVSEIQKLFSLTH